MREAVVAAEHSALPLHDQLDLASWVLGAQPRGDLVAHVGGVDAAFGRFGRDDGDEMSVVLTPHLQSRDP
ncbi:hypothetical protein GCM10017774_13670 [Lentzea cavernae]|uniref:Uncharacterized protein n=1 Tax=Lentzea cavernae TaxID=2020703 RepID=A0ABQ3M358_9PSEU|nr:hypothetical protein GCM10017774_13670 [Lentzea cavernae]